MSCAQINPSFARTYQVNHSHEWAIIHAMWNHSDTGNMNLVLMIHSSLGSWTYNWTHCGKVTMEEWLTGLNFDYMMNKLMGQQFQVDMTTEEAIKVLVKRLEAEELTSLQRKILAVQEERFFEEYELHEMELFEAVDAWNIDALTNATNLCTDYMDWETQKTNPTAALFFNGLWEEFRKHLNGE